MRYGKRVDYYNAKRQRYVTFKSQHEYMWATWFDRLDLDWEYEPVTFKDKEPDLPFTYTPDFGLHENTLFVEVKTYGNQVVKNRLEFCTYPLIIIFGHPLKCDLYVQFPENTKQTHRFTDWASAYNLARNGLPSWLHSTQVVS